jgi:hypothetical protein
MKINYCFCIFFLLSLFLTIEGYSQKDFREGYLITNNSDTLRGLINFSNNSYNSEKCEFKKDESSKPVLYSPMDIKSYLLTGNRYYVSKTITLNNEEKRVFLEFLVDGIIDLFYYNQGVLEYYFIEKNGTLIQLNNDHTEVIKDDGTKYIKYTNQYKGALATIFKDTPELTRKIPNAEFGSTSLVKLTKEYHTMVCNDYSCIDYTKMKKKDIFCEVDAGVIFSMMGLTSSKNFSKDIKPVLGLNFRVVDNRFNSRLNFLAGVNYSRNTYDQEYQNTLYNPRVKYYNIDLTYGILRIPLTIEYSFSSQKIRPTLSFTYNNCFLIKPEYAIEIRNYITDHSYTTVKTESPLKVYQYGLMPGAGIKYIVNKNSYINCVVNYEYRFPFSNLNNILDYLNFSSLIFHISYGYRIK